MICHRYQIILSVGEIKLRNKKQFYREQNCTKQCLFFLCFLISERNLKNMNKSDCMSRNEWRVLKNPTTMLLSFYFSPKIPSDFYGTFLQCLQSSTVLTVSLHNCFLHLDVHVQLTHAVYHISTLQTHACVYYRSIGQESEVTDICVML